MPWLPPLVLQPPSRLLPSDATLVGLLDLPVVVARHAPRGSRPFAPLLAADALFAATGATGRTLARLFAIHGAEI
jgi:hypothetical protein